MASNRTHTLLIAWVVILLGAGLSFGQGLRDAQFFAPAVTSTYGGGVRANEGFFFTFDGLYWAISAPDDASIGLEGATRLVYLSETSPEVTQSNSHTTGAFDADFVGGNRIEAGFIQGHDGFFVSGFLLKSQNQEFTPSEMEVVFDDPPFGPNPDYRLQGPIDANLTNIQNLPVTFDEVTVESNVEMWGVELMYMYRTHPTHRGGIWEFFAGVRYLEFNDRFFVDARGTVDAEGDAEAQLADLAFGATLADSNWFTKADNRVIGPQVGVRMSKTSRRWRLAAEGRFFPGFNSQSIRQRGILGTLLDPSTPTQGLISNMDTTSFNSAAHFDEWSPAAELGVNLEFQLTKAIAAGVGWNGFWIDGIARSSGMVTYEVPHMGINGVRNRQDVFVNGVNFRVVVNR